MIDFDELIQEKEKIDKNDKNDKNKQKEKNKKNEIKDADLDLINNNNKFTIETDLQNIYLFTFDKFIELYKDKLRAFINREQDDDREIFTKVKSTNKNFKKYKRNGFALSNKILDIYTNFSNNYLNELIKAFQLIKCEYETKDSNKNKINSISNIQNNISNKIDYYYFLKQKDKLTDKTERDLKLFGNYEFMEITDVIERHFILCRIYPT